MAGNRVVLTFAGDSKSLDRTFANVGSGAKTMAGGLGATTTQATALGRSVDDMGESFQTSRSRLRGTAQLLSGMSSIMGFSADAAIDMARGFAKMSGGLASAVIPALRSAAGRFGFMTVATVGQTGATVAATGAQVGLNTAMLANPIGAVIAAVVALVAVLVVLYNRVSAVRDVVQSVGRVFGFFRDQAGASKETVDALTLASQKYRDEGKRLEAGVQALADKTRGVATAQWSLADAHRGVGAAQRGLVAAQEKLNDLLAKGAVNVKEVAAAQGRLEDSAKGVTAAQRKLLDAQKKLNDALRPATPETFSEATDGVTQSSIDLTSAGLDLQDAKARLAELTGDETATADDLTRAQIGVTQAELNLDAASDGLAVAKQALVDLDKVGTVESDAYKVALDGLRVAEEGVAAATGKQGEAEAALRVASAGDPGFNMQVAAAKQEVADQTHAVVAAKRAEAAASGELMAALKAENVQLEANARLTKEHANTLMEANLTAARGRGETIGTTRFNPVRAGGGQVFGGLVPGAGGGTTVVVNVAGSVQSERSLVDAVHDGLLSKQRRTGNLGFFGGLTG